ncbi:hypothetical protein ACS0TY_010077 [Phlomoides rotata]
MEGNSGALGAGRGYLLLLENMLGSKFPGTDLKGEPYINSKIHVWKRQYACLKNMLGISSVGLNSSTYHVEALSELWDAQIKAAVAHVGDCRTISSNIPNMDLHISRLFNEKNVGRWLWNGQNTNAINSVKDLINSRFNRNFDVIQVRHRVRFMRCRYRIFDELVHRSDVQWDEDENVIYSSSVTWEILHQEYMLTKTYIYQGEPLYDSLTILYKPEGNESDEE